MGAAKNQVNQINVEKLIKKTAKEVVNELERAKLIKTDGQTYFQKTEKLLYSYNGLVKAIEQKEMDIKYIKEHGIQEKSKSIVLYSSGSGGNSAEEKHIELLEGYTNAKEKTQRLADKIKRALDDIEKDEYYFIINERYLCDENLSNDEIAEKYHVSVRTVQRHRNRLINELQLLLFGADALDYLS